MATYQSQYTGEQIDEAVGKALENSSGSGGSSLYVHKLRFSDYGSLIYVICNTADSLLGMTILEIINKVKVTIPCSFEDVQICVLSKQFNEDTMGYAGAIYNFVTASKTIVNGTCTTDDVVYSL